MPRRKSTTPARPPPAEARPVAVKRQPSPDRTAIVLETTPAKRLRKEVRPVILQGSAAAPEPDSIQTHQSGLVTDEGELSPPHSEDSDLNVDTDDQESQSRPKKAKVYKQRRPRGPRGKYKPREGKLWAGQFVNRRAPAVDEGPQAMSARNESVEAETPGDQGRSHRSASETPSFSSPKSKGQEWYPDPPMMEYPYLQHSFPYHEYEAPPNRVDTSDFGGTPQPLSDDWYRPQESIAGEDLFTQSKLHYSLLMTKKIEVDTDGLRMDIYFQRGFELATRRMLDRIRAKNRLEDIRDEAQRAGGDKHHPSEPIKDPPRVYREPHLTGGPERNDGQTDADASGDDEDMDSHSTPARNPSTFSEASASIDALIPTTTVSETIASTSAEGRSGTEAVAPEMDDRERRIDASTTPTLTDYYQVNAFMTSLFTLGDAQPTSEVPLSPAACRILQTLLLNLEAKMIGMGCHSQRRELTRRLALIDKVQTDTGTFSDTPAPWRENQRPSSAPAENAGTDTTMAASSEAPAGDEDHYISPYRRLVKCDMDGFVLNRKRQRAPSLDAGPSTGAGAGVGAGVAAKTSVVTEDPFSRRPFVSNPLEIPGAMEPFWKAR
ncbi:hypothetical protein BGZ75_008038, partial [Mortierella antarctica]